MNRKPLFAELVWALMLLSLWLGAGSAQATPTFGTRLDNWCALRPVQATPPQQSRPYRAAGSSCAICHTTAGPSKNDLNALGTASASCTSTTCGSTVNPYCIATPPSNASITAPPVGTTVAQGASVTFSAGNATNPDGFPLAYNWLFTGGLAGVTGQSVAVPMTAAGTITATLQVRNSVGMLASGTVPTRAVTVTGAANQAPTATIGSPVGNVTIVQGGAVGYSGGGSDPDGNLPLTFAWTFQGGSPASSTAQNPGTVTYATPGTYSASLVVRDSLGLASAAATRTITVSPTPNQAPTATIGSPAGNVSIAQGGSVSYAGSGSDPDGNLPLTYAWTFQGGSPASSTAQNPGTVTYASPGTYTTSLVVRDALGLASVAASRTITVNPPAANQAPAATIGSPTGNVSITQGGSVSYAGGGSDPDGNLPLTYAWTFQGGSPAGSTAQNPGTVTYATAGTYTASLVVRDSLGLASAAATRTITVNPPTANQAPSATIASPAANVSIAQGGTVSYAGSGSDPDGNLPLTYAWTFQGGSPASSTAQNPGTVTYATAGSYTASLVVRDSLGLASATQSRTITVNPPAANQAPTATISSPSGNVGITQGGTVSFAGSGSDPDGNLPLSYAWSFPGGSPASSTAQNPGAVTYGTAGSYTASLIVRDSLGLASASAGRTVTVTPSAGQDPVATIASPAADVTVDRGGTVTFQGVGSDPGNNLPLKHEWKFPEGTPSSSKQQDPGPVRFNKLGSFRVTYRVTNSRGDKSEFAVRMVTVVLPNQPPVASITAPDADVSIIQGESVEFAGAATDPDNNLPLTYAWSFPGGVPDGAAVQVPGAVRYDTPGTYTVSLTVTDGRGLASAPDTRTLTVAPKPQAATATIVTPAMDISVLPGGAVDFSGAGAGIGELKYEWRFPEGSPSSSKKQNPGSVRFDRPGRYAVTLTVRDQAGKSEVASRAVSVAPANQRPGKVGPCLAGRDDDERDDDDDDDDRDDDEERDDD